MRRVLRTTISVLISWIGATAYAYPVQKTIELDPKVSCLQWSLAPSQPLTMDCPGFEGYSLSVVSLSPVNSSVNQPQLNFLGEKGEEKLLFESFKGSNLFIGLDAPLRWHFLGERSGFDHSDTSWKLIGLSFKASRDRGRYAPWITLRLNKNDSCIVSSFDSSRMVLKEVDDRINAALDRISDLPCFQGRL